MPTVHRFFVDAPLVVDHAGGKGSVVALPDHVARQMDVVLRLRAGDEIVLFDGTGGEWAAEIASVRRGEATARLRRHSLGVPEAPLRLTLCQAMIKADRFEWVLQKGTELGVAAFIPLLTRRVVGASGKGSPAERSRERVLKIERWRRIVVEAAEQCGRTIIPAIHDPRPLRAALDSGLPTVLCWEGGDGALPLREALARATAHQGAAAAGEGMQVFVGPEGGFTPDEVATAAEEGAVLATLGPRILRSETAAIAAATLALLA